MHTKWEIDVLNSYVGFELKYLEISKLIGCLRQFSGSILVANDNLNAFSNLIVKANTSSIDTRSFRRDTILKSTNCLFTMRFTKTTFISTNFSPIDDVHFLINGILILKGSANEIQFTGYVGGIALDQSNQKKLGLELTATINRKDFDLDNKFLATGRNESISDKVNLHLHLQFLHTS